jgi:hypothetical protein
MHNISWTQVSNFHRCSQNQYLFFQYSIAHVLRKLYTEVKVELTVAVELKKIKIMQLNIAKCEKG